MLFKLDFRGHYVIKVECFYPQLIPLPDWIEKRKIIQYTFEEISCHHIIQDNTELTIQPYKINKLKAKAFLTKIFNWWRKKNNDIEYMGHCYVLFQFKFYITNVMIALWICRKSMISNTVIEIWILILVIKLCWIWDSWCLKRFILPYCYPLALIFVSFSPFIPFLVKEWM